VRLPLLVTLLGYAGLIPFLAGPAWLQFAPATQPDWLVNAWCTYVALLAAFLAGTFWGFALPAIQGPAGVLGAFIAGLLMAWGSVLLPYPHSLYALAAVYAMLLLADYWRERTLDTLPGYFRLRATLTAGAIATIAWWLVVEQVPPA
jgi:Protein of unknown function (DUF3429)